jgi:hypothetical protein
MTQSLFYLMELAATPSGGSCTIISTGCTLPQGRSTKCRELVCILRSILRSSRRFAECPSGWQDQVLVVVVTSASIPSQGFFS